MPKILLLIPPLTQLNTPYPATAYLKGFLNQQNISSTQGDLGLDMVLKVFSKQGLEDVFNEAEYINYNISQELQFILTNRKAYEETVDSVISFLQNKKYTLAYRIATRQYLPEGNRFDVIEDLEWFFGNNGIQDKARYLCTLYLEDLSDFIVATVGPHFGFSRYAERIARTAVSFNPVREELEKPDNYLDQILVQCTEAYFKDNIPLIVGFTVPFPGNLYGALKSGQWIKRNFPQTKIVLGGGYANTELRELKDSAVFNYVDYILLDDGEGPLLALYRHLTQPEKQISLKRTYVCQSGLVVYKNDLKTGDFNHSQLPAPDYDGLRLKDYLSVIDMPNPMHRLWSDGRWNKLTIAHGCYWKKCSFCDVSLDYISRYDPAPAKSIVDRMEILISQTGETGFHFVDEAAPPLAMRDLAIELLRRGLQVTWWTNIRFEKTFTEDLCKLLAASGCIAVTGGLEVASDRLLNMMEKGVTIEQVARVCKGFRDTGILVHAYLMYGFPTQTEQETIDSLEIVRQLFEQNLLQSAFWHQFAMTVHSPVGINPEKYLVKRVGPEFKGFASNDLYHEDPTGANHEKYSDGLKKALYNYMHGVGLDFPLSTFFDFKIKGTFLPPTLINNYLKRPFGESAETYSYSIIWYKVKVREVRLTSKGKEIIFTAKNKTLKLELPTSIADFWLLNAANLQLESEKKLTLEETLNFFAEKLKIDNNQVQKQDWWKKIRKDFLWIIKL